MCVRISERRGKARNTYKSVRDNNSTLRIDSGSLEKIGELVDSGVTDSRFAAAFLVEEGMKTGAALFEKSPRRQN